MKSPSSVSPPQPFTSSAVHLFTRAGLLLNGEWRIMLLLAVLPFLLFWPLTLGRESFYFHDVQYYFLPYHKLAADIIWSGDLPLWNPYAFSGIPLLGDGQTAIWYPPNWLFLILPAVYALNLVILSQFSLAGVGMWAFARSLGLHRAPSLIAALAYMFSGFLTTRVVHLSIMSGAAVIPLVFWGIERLLQQPTGRRWAIAAVCVALQAVAGHPQVPVYTAFAAGIYVTVQSLLQAWQQRSARPALNLVRLAIVYAAGFALAAVQLLPWAEFASFSPRAASASFPFVTFHSLRPIDWWLWLFPYGLGGVRESWLWDVPSHLGQFITVWERSGYAGVPTLILALAGVISLIAGSRTTREPAARRRPIWALVAVLVVAGFIAAGRYTVAGEWVYAVPVMGKLRAYSRAVVLLSFAGCALAGWGAQQVVVALPAALRRLRWQVYVAVLTVAIFTIMAVLLANGGVQAASGDEASELWSNLSFTSPRAWLPLALVGTSALILLRPKALQQSTATLLMLAVLLAVDMGLYAVAFNPTIPTEELTGVPPSVSFLQSDPSLYRTATMVRNDVLSPRAAQAQLAISWSMAYGISSINGFNSLQPRRYTDVLFGPEVEDVSYGFLSDPALLAPGNELLTLLDTKYVLVQKSDPVVPGPNYEQVYDDEYVAIYRNRQSWGRAFFVNSVAPVSTVQALAGVRNGAKGLRTMALVEGIDRSLARSLRSMAGGDQATTTQPDVNSLRITTTTSDQRFLVISQPFFPGWEARIDGQIVPLYQTDYILSGLVVPPGEHTITLRYRPRSVLLGSALSATTAGVLLSLVVVGHRRSRSIAKDREQRADRALS